jgi:hypothetical protein
MSDQPQLTPDMPVTVTLTIGQWRGVLETLANGPYRIVAPLMGEIERQANAQIQMQPRIRGNGAVVEEHADG